MDCSGCVAFEKIQQLKAIGKCNLLHVYTPTPTGVGAGDAAASKRDGSLFIYFLLFAMWGARLIKCPPWQLCAGKLRVYTDAQKKIGDLGRELVAPLSSCCNDLMKSLSQTEVG